MEAVMSQTTTAQRHGTRVHLPLTPILAVLATAIIAAAVLILINQPTTTSTSTETQAGVASAAQAVAVPRPESPALRRQLAETQNADVPAAETFRYARNHVQGMSLDPASSYELAPPAPKYLPGDVADPHPLNHFAGQPY
jgi:hypothetical protein